MATQKQRLPKIDVATFKDLLGVTRKYAIPLLEYLDQQRITRRVGDERIFLERFLETRIVRTDS